MAKAATQTRHNRTITVDFHDETTYDHLLGDGKAFLECALTFNLVYWLSAATPGDLWRWRMGLLPRTCEILRLHV